MNTATCAKAVEAGTKLRKALADLVGVSTKKELENMELTIQASNARDADKTAHINAIHILIETAEE